MVSIATNYVFKNHMCITGAPWNLIECFNLSLCLGSFCHRANSKHVYYIIAVYCLLKLTCFFFFLCFIATFLDNHVLRMLTIFKISFLKNFSLFCVHCCLYFGVCFDVTNVNVSKLFK